MYTYIFDVKAAMHLMVNDLKPLFKKCCSSKTKFISVTSINYSVKKRKIIRWQMNHLLRLYFVTSNVVSTWIGPQCPYLSCLRPLSSSIEWDRKNRGTVSAKKAITLFPIYTPFWTKKISICYRRSKIICKLKKCSFLINHEYLWKRN